MSDDDVNVSFGATVDGALGGINQITSALESFGANVEGLTEPLAALGEAAVAAFAVEKITEFAEHMTEVGVDLKRMEVQLGDTAEQVDVLRFAAENSDSQVELLARTIGQFARIAEESVGTNNNAARALAVMGINITQLTAQGKNMNDIFEIAAQKLATYKDGLNKTALETAIMGGRSSQLALALKELGENSDEIKEAVDRSGIAIKGFEDDAVETQKGITELEGSLQGLKERGFEILKPAIDLVVTGLTNFFEEVNRILDRLPNLITELGSVKNAMDGLVWAFDKITGKPEKTDFEQYINSLDGSIKNTTKSLNEMLGVQKQEENQAPQIAPDPKKAMDDDIQLHKAMLQEEVTDVDQNLQAKMVLQQQYYDWLKQKYPQNAVALSEAGRSIAQTQDQEAKASAASWNSFFNSLNGGIMGMLKGTETFKQSLSNMLDSVVELGLKAIEKVVANWLGAEITKTLATNAGNVARTASDTAAASAGIAIKKADDSTAVMTSAKTGAANAYASTSAIPVIGPILAPAAAAVAFGAIMAFDSFETGTPYVPATGPYMLHEGEAVVPAQLNQAAGGGGGDVHFHVSAMDSRSVQHFFETHAQTIAKTVNKQYQRGNSAFGYPR